MKRAKVTMDGFLKQVDSLMPEEMRADTKAIFLACKDAPAGIKDQCEAGYTLYTCTVKEAGDKFDFA